MKSRILSVALMVAAMLTGYARKEAEPTVLTIDGKPIGISEFEYLYNKNRSQQSAGQSRDEYVDMFVIYKLKVADAIANGVDTTAAFKREFEGYRQDLATPYLIDNSVRERLVNEAYERLKEDVEVSHIMVESPKSIAGQQKAKALLDSIRTEILAGRADFDQMAVKYSVDPQVPARQSGYMGWISGNGMYPYPFEKAAYDTKTGEISPIVDSGFGYHIIKVNSRRPAPGTVLVEHILKLTDRLPEAQAELKKHAIDSIYEVVKAGADFADVARRESEDPGSAMNGGRLDWFGPGRMVPEFEQTAFAMANGEISKPFKTAYGYHIIHKLDQRGVPSLEESRKQIEQMIDNDARAAEPRKAKINQFRQKYGVTKDEAVINDILNKVEAHGAYDTTMIARFSTDERVLSNVPGNPVTVADVIETMKVRRSVSPDVVEPVLRNNLESLESIRLTELATNDLEKEETDYRNLLNEYRDGMLLFEISNRKVWDKANRDKEGLEKFFNKNRGNYKWDKPKFKGYVVFATTDSIAQLAQKYLNENNIESDSLATSLRRQFGKEIRIEKVIAAQGENDIIDAVGFGAPRPEAKTRWASYFPYRGKVIAAPEEAADVRGQVTADYQALLEKEWIDSLRASHKIKINKKVLKNVK